MKETKSWNKLDNAAKIFPPTTSKRDTKVFRFMCELTQPVDRDSLQTALARTLPDFPLYRSVLKQGLFWHYFEQSSLQPTVEEEKTAVCEPLYNPDRPSLLFRVSYFHTRINLEVFHALTDGSGAIQFLRALVYAYLSVVHPEDFPEGGRIDDYDASFDQRQTDAFEKYYDKEKQIPTPPKTKAYRMFGEKLPNYRVGITEGSMPIGPLLQKAHEYHVTLSEFLTAVLILSLRDGMSVRQQKKPVVVTVPVDLRRFFPAQTARNFFGVIQISHHFRHDGSEFEDILKHVHRSFAQQLTRENMLGIINKYAKLENNPFVKAVPLALKTLLLKIAGWHADRQDTVALSNIGKISMPEPAREYIRFFDVFLSTKRPQLCVCSFGDTLTLSVSSPFKSTDLQRLFFRHLSAIGAEVQIATNLDDQGGI